MQKKLLIGLLSICFLNSGYAQSFSNLPITDGFDAMMANAKAANPNYAKDVVKLNEDIRQKGATLMSPTAAAKTTATKEVALIFHVVLTDAQINQIGGKQGVIDRINSQVAALNFDYNGANTDSVLIPADFKPLYGNVGIHFALAHKDPDGKYTPGYEFVSTTKNGFDVNTGTTGSRFACSDAKFTSTGGVDGWDPQQYINIWVINITPAGVGGVGTPPPYAAYGGTSQFPWNEQGIAMAYFALGKKTSNTQYFPAAAAIAGRTLTHEMGHFFNLFHPFGISTFNNSSCTDDDGVTDTPPESAPVQSICPAFPMVDGCSPNAPGVMFMNHMDYSADTCRLMFTSEQVARMNVELAAGGFREPLMNHPELIYYYPTSIPTVQDAHMQVYPNPASKQCYIRFNPGNLPETIVLLNNIGQVVKTVVVAKDVQQIQIDLNGLTEGIYTIRCRLNDGVATQKLVVN